jgi:hypothetical protein
MAVHVRRGQGVIVYHFWPLRILTPSRLDLSTGRFSRWLSLHGVIRSRVVLAEDVNQ